MLIGSGSFVVIVIVVLIIFGFKKLFELGKVVGDIFCEFKNVIKGLMSDDEEKKKED